MSPARRLDLAFAAVAALVVAIYLAQFLSSSVSAAAAVLAPQATLVFGALVKLLFLALGAAYATRAARAFEPGNPARPAWRLLAAGLALYLLGQSSLARYQVLRLESAPFPSIADVFFVAGTLAFIAALATFIRAYRRTKKSAHQDGKSQDPKERSPQLNTCYAWSTEREVVQRWLPQFYTGKPQQEGR